MTKFVSLSDRIAKHTMNPKNDNSEATNEKRSWEPWTRQENKIFFESLLKHGRSWSNIAKDIGTKRQEQVEILSVTENALHFQNLRVLLH
jgi:hypothetical protein